MSGEDPYFLEWKEQFVSQERGNRVVHYYLKDSSGESVLAIVGTERSVRHMFYVVSNEFVEAYGSQTSIHAGFKWRSRREVVDWLTSMTSKQSELSKNGSEQAEGSLGISGRPAIISNGRNSDIAWSGTAWLCGKQLKHYPGFSRNGITIDTYSFVFVMGKGETRYLAYLEDMYEDKRGQKKVKVRWFHRSDEVKGVTPVRNSHPKEVFITSYAQVISAECVDGPATVVNREHYDKCLAAFPHELSSKIHLCFRQFRNNRVKSFDLSKLRGYFDQPVLACLLSSPMLKPESAWNGIILEEDEDMSPSEDVKVGGKRTRSGRGHQKSVTHSGIKRSGEGLPLFSFESAYKKLKCGLLGPGLDSLKHVESKLCYAPNFQINDKIEVLCQDSGIRGCWFRCTVLQVSRKKMKVRYDDLQDEGGSGNLEEWIPAVRFASNDKIGMRHPSRLTVRPVPPDVDQNEVDLEIGGAVDAWWSDGWWEGVVTEIKSSVDDNLQIFFPGESMFKNMERKDLRISRDWVRDQWIDIEAKPDVLSAMRADATLDLKLSASSTGARDVKSGDISMSASGVDASAKPKSVEDVNLNSGTTCSDSLAENVDTTDRNNKLPHECNRHDEFLTKENHSNVDDGQNSVDNDSEDNDLDEQEILDDLQKIAESHVDEVALGSSGDHCNPVEVMGIVA